MELIANVGFGQWIFCTEMIVFFLQMAYNLSTLDGVYNLLITAPCRSFGKSCHIYHYIQFTEDSKWNLQ